MCLGGIARLLETWEEDGVRLGRLDDGSVVTLSFLPDATAGAYVLVHLGIPVEVLDAGTAEEALALRGESP
jgi:hydrogenase expression/formation protein HypC